MLFTEKGALLAPGPSQNKTQKTDRPSGIRVGFQQQMWITRL